MTRTEACFRFALLASTALSAVPAHAGDRLPVGGSVAHGSVDISAPSANAMAIRQSSSTAIVNWRGFSIGEGARVDIRQPSSSSAMLNRVTGSTPSTIAGQLNANGQVYLVNPNGIAITPSGTVRTGAFVASTLATSDEDFIAGRRSFAGKGRSAAVVNRGSITVGRGGYAALIGGKVDNAGTISAEMGRIGLGAGERATLDVSGDGFLQVAVPSDDAGDDGPLIRHSGRLSADGGRVELKAATARQMARQVINLSGVVEARSVSGRSGAIVLGGGDGGTVRVSGRLEAGAPRTQPALAAITPPPPRPGGTITVTGVAIELAGATLDASGPAGGGTIRIGGDWQGGGTLPRARTTSVDGASLIAADALDSGDGGSIVVWSDGHTRFDGRISARGGPLGGDGGAAEVSGKARLSFTGLADLSAPRGTLGTLLLDPGNIVISDGTTTGEFVDADAEEEEEDGGVSLAAIPVDNAVFEPSQADSILNAADLVDQLQVSNVLVVASDEFDGDGNITVEAPISWTAATELTFETEAGDVTINAPITTGDGAGFTAFTLGDVFVNAPITLGQNATLALSGTDTLVAAPVFAGNTSSVTLGSGEGSLTVTAPLTVGAGDASLTLFAGTDITLGATATWGAGSFADISAGGDIALNGNLSGTAGELIISAGGTVTALGAVDVDTFILGNGDWQQVAATLPAFSADDFRIADDEGADPSFLRALGGDGTPGAPYLIADVYGLQGIGSSFGDDAGLPVLDASYALAGNIDASSTEGWSNPASDDSGFTPIAGGGAFTGDLQGNGFSIGGLFISFGEENTGLFATVGDGGSIDNIILTDPTISGGGLVGGLAGQNAGVISRARVEDGSVFGYTPDQGVPSAVGGLVGQNLGSVTQSFSTTPVTGSTLVEAIISIGGLVGQNGDGEFEGGTVTDSYAAGAVLAEDGAGNAAIGGLVGSNAGEGIILRSYAVGTVTADNSDATAAGGLVGDNLGLIDQTYATGAVTAAVGEQVGGLVGGTLAEGVPAPVFNSFWDSATTLQPTSAGGGTPRTTAEFRDTEDFMALAGAAGWSFTDTWAPPDPGHYPELYSISPVIWADVGNVTAVYGSPESLAPPVTPSGGPGSYVFDTSTTAPVIPVVGVGQGVGTHTVTGAPSYTSAGGVDYRVFSTPAELVVTPAPLTIAADDRTKPYGQAINFRGTEFTADGLVPGDSITAVDLASAGAAAGANVGDGPFPITASNARGAGLRNGAGVLNYTITYLPGTLTVTPGNLVISADDQSKRYGREIAFRGTEFTTRGLAPGDSITGVDLASAGAARGANVGEGPFPIAIGNARGVGLTNAEGVPNYALSYEPGTLTVTPAPLVVRADDQTKRFGRTFVFAGTEFTTQSLVNGDTVGSVLLRSDGAPAGALPSFTPYPIFVSEAAGTGLSFGGVPNYDISYVPGEMYVLLDPSQSPNFNAGLRLVDYYTLRNPADVIELAGVESFASGDGGPMLGPDQGAGTTLARETAADTLNFLESLATRLEARVSACNPVPPNGEIFLACVRDALAEYASQIDGRILDLPEPLRQVSAVIRESASRIEGVRADAARRLALATTDAERAAIEREALERAGAVMQSAVVEIRQAIQLIRAEDDPQLASLQSRQGVAITAALQNVEDELTRAVGL